MSDRVITLFLADDHQLIVEGMIALVSQDPCIQVVGYCNTGREVLEKVQEILPDVLVLDISLPGMNGLDVCRQVKKALPQTAIMMLTMHTNEQCILEALESGALGYLVKEAVALEFCEAVHAVARGEIYLGQSIPISILGKVNHRGADPYSAMSEHQHQLLQLSAEGKSHKQIAEILNVPCATVEAEYAALTKALGLPSQTDVVRFAIRRHLITVE